MALVPAQNLVESSVIAEVDMGGGSDPSSVTVRATVVQASTVFYDTPATLDKAERLIADAAAYGSQLVVFPEAFIGGYPRGSTFGVTIGSRSVKGREEFRKYHAAAIAVPGWYALKGVVWVKTADIGASTIPGNHFALCTSV
ncbi:hypothetical protein COCNU_07G013280 [Cocos nucifera]|uniref:cyanoalanine nitrilase n=1 Tax=Cocos nucifera TaxID=13894 RepID=A0A8K0IFQ9_COCNU|nr:hypothetical protein COCNU_07G013280 [Cocos nucifera]